METIEILRKLVSFNTIEDKENRKIINWIKDYLKELKFTCKEITDEKTKKSCLIAEIGENPIIGFSGHVDTVNITKNWTKNPFELCIEDDKIYGLGVCDMKGGIAAFLKACSNINKDDLKNGIRLFFTYDEEIGFSGIKLLLKEKIKFPKYLILAEPTDLQPVTATKGCMEMKITFYGKSAHSSTPSEGKNAILESYDFIKELLAFSKELEKEKNHTFPIPYTTINIGKILGGDAVNKVPDRCYVEFDARTVKTQHNAIIEEKVKNLLKKYDSKLNLVTNIQPIINTIDSDMIEAIESKTQYKQKSENFVTEASFIPNTKSVILGVGPITSHQSDEYIEKNKLDKLVEIYNNIIQKFCY